MCWVQDTHLDGVLSNKEHGEEQRNDMRVRMMVGRTLTVEECEKNDERRWCCWWKMDVVFWLFFDLFSHEGCRDWNTFFDVDLDIFLWVTNGIRLIKSDTKWLREQKGTQWRKEQMWVIGSETSMRWPLSGNEDGRGATTKMVKLLLTSNLFGSRN